MNWGDWINSGVPFSWPIMGLCLLVAVSQGIGAWQLLAAFQFPLHRRSPPQGPPFLPGVSLLKPLKGADASTANCLRSWFAQVYGGPIQLLLGVKDSQDPVCEIVRGLIAEFPKCNAQLIICSEQPGANAKVCTLVQLEILAHYDVLVVSDADVRIDQDFLTEVVKPLTQSSVGLVNCFYQLANPTTAAQQWEAVATNADFWSQVLQSRMLKPQDFALGAVMAVRRDALQKIGGFRAFVDHLADDYQLGKRVSKEGWTIALSPVVVSCWDAPANWTQVWAHQLRWARTVRVCQPGPYAASIINNVTFWTVLAGWVGRHHETVLLGVSVVLGLRLAQANALVTRLTGQPFGFLRCCLFVPIKDLLGAVIWALAFFGNTVVWRGITYRVGSDGKLSQV